ncbi:MAG: hypothetical protein NTV52_01700, partial [Acidobacteria bacterium]|nr:hypothetical protein [Acidobacteriota bacterium]
MPAVVAVRPAQLPPGARRRLTRADCEALEKAGLLEWEHFELSDGALIRKLLKSRLHSIVPHILHVRLRRVWGEEFVAQEVSIDLGPRLTSGPLDLLLWCWPNCRPTLRDTTWGRRRLFTPARVSPNTG